jgi:uroporphyrinogen III methyltransferase/synthase
MSTTPLTPDRAASASSPSSPLGAQSGVVYLVGGGPGDPGLLTLRGAELLATADVILHDELVHRALLDHARADAAVRHVGKRGGDAGTRAASQELIDAEMIAEARSGRSVVRLKGGDPFLFGRGSEEAENLVAAGVPFEVVPGVPSPLGASAYAGISLTHRDLASSVTFVSAVAREGADFAFDELASIRGTVCVLMAMRRLADVCARLVRDARRDPATPAAVIQWGTRAEQVVVEGRLDAIAGLAAAAGLGSPAIVVVGEVVGLRRTLRWFDRRPLFGKRVLVTRPAGQAGATSELLRRHGADPIELPAIALFPPPDPARVAAAVRELDRFDVVAFTSENGVLALFHELDAQEKDARAFGRARLAAIGSGTAQALRARGVRADIVPTSFVGEALADAILADAPIAARLAAGEGARVLVPRALVAREVLGERLTARGCTVDIVPVYETRPASVERRDELVGRLENRGVDIVMLTSSSTADSLCDLLGDRAAELLSGVVVASIGPITSAAAVKRGLTVAVTATVSTTPGLVHALEEHVGRS